MIKNFTHLILHSEFSHDKGLVTISKLKNIKHLIESRNLSITDTNNFFAAVQLADFAKNYYLKCIYGSSILVKNDHGIQSLYILAKNPQGYNNICSLLSEGFKGKKWFNGLPVYSWDDLTKLSEVIAISGGMYGALGHELLYGTNVTINNLISKYLTIFKEGNFLIDIHRVYDTTHEEHYNGQAITYGDKFGIPIVATNYVCFIDSEDLIAHKIKAAINRKELLYGNPWHATKQMYFKSNEEMSNLFHDIPNSLINTEYVVKRCNVYLSTDQVIIFPKYSYDDSYSPNNDNHKLYFREKVNNQFLIKFSHLTPDQRKTYQERLDKEITIIERCDFIDYFLIVADFVSWAKKNNIRIGPGRGSSAGSLLAYTLDITQVDSVQHGLFFERFLDTARNTKPDIDVDICVEKREEVIKYIKHKYGEDKVAQIIAFSHWGSKGIIKDISRVFGMFFNEVNAITKHMSIKPISIEENLKLSPLFTEDMNTIKNKEILYYGKQMEGLFHTTTRHAAGIVILPMTTESIGLYSNSGYDDHLTTQWDMNDLDKVGFIKFDCLGLRTLTSIDDTVTRINKYENFELNIDQINLNDNEVFNMISSGKTDGIFQMESFGIQSLIRETKVTCFEDIVILIALYRPGPMEAGIVDKYVKIRQNDDNDSEALDYRIQKILSESYGLIVYQEQIMQICHQVAGMSLEDGHYLQKAMSKKISSEVKAYYQKFIEGAVKNNLTKEEALKIFNTIESFAKYGFNKSHATAYGKLTYQTAYLKHYYPVHFYLAIISKESNPIKVHNYILGAKRSGVIIKGPCINYSYDHYAYYDSKTIICGLLDIKGISSTIVTKILEERKVTLFNSLNDLVYRVFGDKNGQGTVSLLIMAGACDIWGDRSLLIAQLPQVFKFSTYKFKVDNKIYLKIPSKPPTLANLVAYHDYIPRTIVEKIKDETDKLGICLSYDVWKVHESLLSRFNLSRITDDNHDNYHHHRSNNVFTYAGVLINESPNKNGLRSLLTIESDNNIILASCPVGKAKPPISSIVLIYSSKPVTKSSFYNENYIYSNSPCVSLENAINKIVKGIVIVLESSALKKFYLIFTKYLANSSDSEDQEFCDIVITVKDSKREFKLTATIKVSVYELIWHLKDNCSNLNIILKK